MSMKKYLDQSEWLGLDQELREKLKNVFDINRSEGMKVVNNRLVSDGCSQGDLIAGITIGKMIEYLDDTSFGMNTDNSEKIFDELFERVVNKVWDRQRADDVGLENIPKEDEEKTGMPDDSPATIGPLKLEKELNINQDDNTNNTNNTAKTEDKRAKVESERDKLTPGSGDDRPSGDDSINAGSGDRQDIQRPKAKDKGKRAKHTSRKRAVKKTD